ncbi:cytochrome-c oxidase, cbb3-type subunit III [Labrys okinawensis]|uniref:cytochrome-c oxidase, cbb3-type subunit III n=1 Tax=Labrys okinawensis TaxID=346911 RepID=UPI0039BC5E8D
MPVEERDSATGYLTTGHEWNGITELNTPVPRPVYFFLILAATFALLGWILWPAWPIGTTYTKGILNVDQRTSVQASLEQAAMDRDVWAKRIAAESFPAIQADSDLMRIVHEAGPRLFGDNCAACHRADARGQRGFPNLTTSSWLWGGSPDAIFETIRVGINSAHPKSHISQMPAFGRDKLLPADSIDKVVAYVRSLTDPSVASEQPASTIDAGRAIFKANCTVCHGDDAKGKTDVGAPNLTDRFSIYGGDQQSVLTTLWGGRQGHMPTWEERLSPVSRKILALYVTSLRAPDQ